MRRPSSPECFHRHACAERVDHPQPRCPAGDGGNCAAPGAGCSTSLHCVRATDPHQRRPKNVNTRAQLGVNIAELYLENDAGRLPSITCRPPRHRDDNQGIKIEHDNVDADNSPGAASHPEVRRAGHFELKNENANNNTQGLFTFAPGGGRTAFQNFLTGNRDGLCGSACTYAEAQIDATNHLRWKRWELFAQDSWRIRPNVTLDLGVRYGLYPGVEDINNVLSTFVPSLYDRAKAPLCADATCSALVPNTGDLLNGLIVGGFSSRMAALLPDGKTDIQPRIGLSWDPRKDGKAIVRAAYGVYYDQPLVGIFEQNAFSNPPYVQTVNLLNPSLSNPSAGSAPGTTGLRTLFATSAPFRTPRTQQWNVGYQRMLYRRGSLDIGYVGSHGDRLIQQVDLNQPNPAAVIANGLNISRPFVGYAGITMRQTTAYNNYKGLLTQFRHESGRLGTYVVNYTLSRNRASATNDRDAADNPQNPADLTGEYADARTDRRPSSRRTHHELPFFQDRHERASRRRSAAGRCRASTLNPAADPRIVANRTAAHAAAPTWSAIRYRARVPFRFDPAAFAPPADCAAGAVLIGAACPAVTRPTWRCPNLPDDQTSSARADHQRLQHTQWLPSTMLFGGRDRDAHLRHRRTDMPGQYVDPRGAEIPAEPQTVLVAAGAASIPPAAIAAHDRMDEFERGAVWPGSTFRRERRRSGGDL